MNYDEKDTFLTRLSFVFLPGEVDVELNNDPG